MVGSSDSDSEDDKRVVRSAKDKRFEELQATCDEIRARCRASALTTEQNSCCFVLFRACQAVKNQGTLLGRISVAYWWMHGIV